MTTSGLITVERQGLLMADRVPQATPSEWAAIRDGLEQRVSEGIGIRPVVSEKGDGFLVLSGAASPCISDSDPIEKNRWVMLVQPTDASIEADNTARAMN